MSDLADRVWVVVRYVSSRSTSAVAPLYIVGLYTTRPKAEEVLYPLQRGKPNNRYGLLECGLNPKRGNPLPESE